MKFAYRRSLQEEERIEVEVVPLPDGVERYQVTVRGRVFELSAHLFHRVAWLKQGGEIVVQYAGKEYRLFDAGQRQRALPTSPGDLCAPMAGKIIRVYVRPGQQVRAGEPLVILEAMKMEHQLTAPRDGVVARVLCSEGEQVLAGAELVVLEAAVATP